MQQRNGRSISGKFVLIRLCIFESSKEYNISFCRNGATNAPCQDYIQKLIYPIIRFQYELLIPRCVIVYFMGGVNILELIVTNIKHCYKLSCKHV